MSEPKLNKDGLPIGQPVDFATIQRANKARAEKQEKPAKPKKEKAE